MANAIRDDVPVDTDEDVFALDDNRLTDDEIVALLRHEKAISSSYQNTNVTYQRAEAMKYYLGQPYGDEQDERSKVVTTEVRDTIESILPQLVKLFLSSDRVVRYDATTADEEDAAEQATDMANHVLRNDNDGFMLFHNWFKDALLQKNGVVKAYWDETVKVTEEIYEGLLEQELMALLQDDELEPVEMTQSDMVTMPAPPSPPGQPPVPPQPVPVFDVKVKRTRKTGRIKVSGVPPEEFLIALNARSIQKARFCAHRRLMSISELIEMGIPKEEVWDLGGEASDGDLTGERYERFAVDGGMFPESQSIQHAMRQLWVTECYYLVDTDGDGVAERWRFLLAGQNDKLALKERWDGDWPFASITPVPMPHKYFGMSLHDLIKDIQRIKSTMTRQLLDNIYQINNNRMIVQEGLVNIDDLLTNRPGGIVRTTAAPSQVAVPLQPNPIGQVIVPALEYLDSVMEKRTGITAYNQGLDANSLNKTATGINIINNAAQERQLLIARIFAETGVRDLFRHILQLLVRHQDKPRTIKLRGKWVAMDPSRWNAEMAVTVDVALGTSNRGEQIGILSQILAVQKEAIMGGAPIASWSKVYNTLAKLIEAAGLKSVDHYFDDPAQVPPQPQPPSPEAVKAQADMETTKAKLEHEKAMRAFELEEQAKQNLLQIGLKKLDIQSRERIARQSTTTDILKMLNDGADAQAEAKAGEKKKPRRITVKRNPLTREVEEIIPIYEAVEDQLGGASSIAFNRNAQTGEIDGFEPRSKPVAEGYDADGDIDEFTR